MNCLTALHPGLGLYVQELMSLLTHVPDPDDLTCNLSSLQPHEHLARCSRICQVYFFHNIAQLDSSVSPEVLHAMRSIVSPTPHPDFQATLRTIRSGGQKAVSVYTFFLLWVCADLGLDWLKDKEAGHSIVLAGLYCPLSKID